MIFLVKSVYLAFIMLNMNMHPVHVSITNMDYNINENEIDYSIKVFKDDFQLLFFHLYEKNIDFNDSVEVNKNFELISAYLKKSLQLEVNGEICDQKVNRFEIKSDAIWFYCKSPIKKKIISIKILNTVLLDLYADQKNLLIFTAGDFEKGYQFNLKNKNYLIEF